jgi:T5SS/PEP-CTERM-associated repeat protein
MITAICLAGSLIAGVYADRPATYWNVATGDFYDFSNWNLGAPSSTLDARIDNAGKAVINTEAFQSIPYVYLGSAQNTSGTLEVSTGGIASFTTMIVGALNATGTLNIIGGGRLTTFGGPIGSDYLGVGIATVDGVGSKWTITGSEMALGGNGTGTARLINGGNLNVANGNGRIQMANHPVSEGNLHIGTGGIPGTVNASQIFNGEGRATVVFNHSSSSYSFAPKFLGLKTVNGYLNIRHEGPGTTVLTAAESNLAGIVTVSAGTLLVTGNLKGSIRDVLVDEQIIQEKNIGETVVQSGGTLGGTGFIEGKTTVGGILAPGMSVGALKFGGDLLLESSGTLRIEIGGTVRGLLHDAIDLAGALTLGGKLEIVLTNGFEPQEGQTFELFDGYTSIAGDFSEILFSGEGYAGTFDPLTGSLVVIPEPGILGLAAVGGAAMALRRRRRNAERITN